MTQNKGTQKQKAKQNDQGQYLNKMKTNQRISSALKDKQSQLINQIDNGKLELGQEQNFKEGKQGQHNLVRNNSSKLKQSRLLNSRISQNQAKRHPFYLSSNPELIQKQYQRFLALRQQYSHQNTQQVLKQVQSKIKGWMQRQKTSQIKRQQIIEQKLAQHSKSKQKQEQIIKQSQLIKQQQYLQQIMTKKQKRQQAKRIVKELMEKQSISKQFLKQKGLPLFKEKQKQFEEKKSQKLFQYKLALQQRKNSNLLYSPIFIKQQQKQYLQEIKQKEEKRERRQNQIHSRKIKTEQASLNSNSKKSNGQFSLITKQNRQQIQIEQQKKRNRIRQYVNRLKSMSPDKTTLQRIKKVKEQILLNEKLLEKDKKKAEKDRQNKQKTKKLKQQIFNHNQNIKQKQNNSSTKMEDINPQSFELKLEDLNPKQMDSKHDSNRNSSEAIQASKVYQSSKPKQHKRQPKKSKSTHTIQRNQRQFTLPLLDSRPKYKNYLSQMKFKPIQPLNQVDKIKKNLKYPEQILYEFNRLSNEAQKQMFKKIKQFKSLQKNKQQKYERNLAKQVEIDQLYHKGLQYKLACLEME